MLLVEDLKKSYIEPDGTPLPILDVPRFAVAAGEQLVLVGRSGCGKTTLLHVVAGISRPDSGRVQIDGRDITRLSEAGARPRCGPTRSATCFKPSTCCRGSPRWKTCCWE